MGRRRGEAGHVLWAVPLAAARAAGAAVAAPAVRRAAATHAAEAALDAAGARQAVAAATDLAHRHGIRSALLPLPIPRVGTCHARCRAVTNHASLPIGSACSGSMCTAATCPEATVRDVHAAVGMRLPMPRRPFLPSPAFSLHGARLHSRWSKPCLSAYGSRCCTLSVAPTPTLAQASWGCCWGRQRRRQRKVREASMGFVLFWATRETVENGHCAMFLLLTRSLCPVMRGWQPAPRLMPLRPRLAACSGGGAGLGGGRRLDRGEAASGGGGRRRRGSGAAQPAAAGRLCGAFGGIRGASCRAGQSLMQAEQHHWAAPMHCAGRHAGQAGALLALQTLTPPCAQLHCSKRPPMYSVSAPSLFTALVTLAPQGCTP